MENPTTSKSGIRPGIILVVLAVLGLLIGGRMLGWLGAKKTTDETAVPAASASSSAPTTPVAPRRLTGDPNNPGRVTAASLNGRRTATPGAMPSLPGGAAAIPGTTPMPEPTADWSAKLDDILGSNEDETKKADLLLGMWKTLPEDGQVEIMQHISNLLPDEKFSALAQTFTNATTPEAVLDIIMTDTLNRPNGIKLPVLLDVARTPGHPKAEEARDILEVFVDADHGTDWPKWEKAVKDWLKENPDEPEITN
ncbi:MAG: hypothetical protein QOF48_3610 [Verrucomicrobiota bacterium]|jgi:hypothetical protein